MSEELLPISLRSGERVLWSESPKKAPFIMKSLIFTLVGLFLALPATAVLLEIAGAPLLLLVFPGLIAIIGYLIAIIPPLRNILSLRRIKYIVTNERIVILGGALGLSVRTIEFPEIEAVVVRKGFWDKRFGTSTLYLIIKGIFILPSFSSITNANSAKRLIERLLAEHKSV